MIASREESDAQNVRGERSEALVHAARSLQSRVSSLLAAGLMIVLGVSALTWYYARTLTRQTQARAAAQSTAANRAQAEMPLPSLGRIEPPRSAGAPAKPDMGQPEPAAPAELPLAELSTPAQTPRGAAPPFGSQTAQSSPAKSPTELARERRLSGGVFARVSQSASTTDPGAPGVAKSGIVAESATEAPAPEEMRPNERSDGALAAWLRPDASSAVQARLLPTARFLLPKGAFIDCTLETAIDSTLPGMTTCITAADTFSADGKVVLLERGSKLVGETRGQVRQGQARVFVIWTQVRTPTGVVVPLDSPATDEVGRSGLPGEVQRHFWERFGAAMLISVVDGAVQAGVQASNRSGGAVIYAPSASQDVLTEVLKDTANIPPTVVKRNGDRIQVLLARDVDFRPVYELRTPPTGH